MDGEMWQGWEHVVGCGGMPHTPNPWPHSPPPHVPKPKVKKTARGTPRALVQPSRSTRAALHKHSWRAARPVCTTSLHIEFAHRVCTTSLHNQFAHRVCTTSLHIEFDIEFAHRVCTTSLHNQFAHRITTPYSFPASQQADKEFTIQVNLHD